MTDDSADRQMIISGEFGVLHNRGLCLVVTKN